RIAVNLVGIHYQVIKTFHTLKRLEGDWVSNMADPPNNLSALTLGGIDHKASEDEEMPLFIPKIHDLFLANVMENLKKHFQNMHLWEVFFLFFNPNLNQIDSQIFLDEEQQAQTITSSLNTP
uniref:Uncharacterized protein n=1 Tax=Capitella teleta TaxID=283909 RepID=X2AEP3_CAPTE